MVNYSLIWHFYLSILAVDCIIKSIQNQVLWLITFALSYRKSKTSIQQYLKAMQTQHRVILGSSQQMHELLDGSVQLMVTSPPYPMIAMWDELFANVDPHVAELFKKLDEDANEETVKQIYDAMHDNLAKVWAETYRVLVDGGIACINIGDATRSLNGKFQLYPNHSRITEV